MENTHSRIHDIATGFILASIIYLIAFVMIPYVLGTTQPDPTVDANNNGIADMYEVQSTTSSSTAAATTGAVEICTNKVDDDMDTLVDCWDNDCRGRDGC